MSFQLTERDLLILSTIHPDLRRVVLRAARTSPFRFRVTEGIRTVARQHDLVARGASQTMNSRHLTGHAVDFAPYFDADGDGDVDAKDMYHWPLYHQLAPIVKAAALAEGVAIEWGGDWRSFKDGPHWQLPWATHPATNGGVSAASPRTTEVTEAQHDTQNAVVKAAASTTAAVATVEPVLPQVVELLNARSADFTSGDFVRFAFAALLVGLAVWTLVRRK
jgi:peptidoglycan L-alanyl-D-glutamate endopeptidase CwlK